MVFTEEQNLNLDSRLVAPKPRSFPPNMCMNTKNGSSVADIGTQGPNMNSLDYSFVEAMGRLEGEGGCEDFDKATELTNMQQQAFQHQQAQPQNDCQEFMDFQQQAKDFPIFSQPQQSQQQHQHMDDFMSSFQQQQMAQMESENKNSITGINFTATAQFNLQATATTNGIDFLNPFGMQPSSNMLFDQAEQEMGGAVAYKDTIIADRRTVPPQLAQMWSLFKN